MCAAGKEWKLWWHRSVEPESPVRAAAAPGTGQAPPHLSLHSAVHVQIHRDFGHAQEQFVNRRQVHFCLDTLSLLAVALLMAVLGTSSTRCMQEGGSSFAGRTPSLRASAFQDPAAGLEMGQLLKCQEGA